MATNKIFQGYIYIFHSFDIGEDINLEAIKNDSAIVKLPLSYPKYFKNYHVPLRIEHPKKDNQLRPIDSKIYNFGVLTLRYKVPFESSFEELKPELIKITNRISDQAFEDAHAIYKQIHTVVKQAKFFHLSNVYVLLAVEPHIDPIDSTTLKEQFGNEIVSLVRFETEMLSSYTRNQILNSSFGYYKGETIIIDTDAAFMYNADYEEALDIFEFASMEQLELQYFDRLLDAQLNAIYNQEVGSLPLSSYLPFWGTLKNDPVGDLGKLRVDISVITERITSNIKLVDEPYISEMYNKLSERLDLHNWREALRRKLDIVHDVRSVYANKVDIIREDMLSVLIIILILMEFIVAFLHYIK